MNKTTTIYAGDSPGRSRVIGGGLIIAGTSIGAGMLSLPLVSSGLGFTTSLVILFGLWALMTYTALLMLEVHQFSDKTATLHTLAKQFLGDKGKLIAGFSMLFLFYSLSAAYMAGGGSQLTDRVHQIAGIEMSPALGAIVFGVFVALVVVVGTHLVDKVNRVLFGLMLLAMAFVIVSLAPNIHGAFLLSTPMQAGLIVVALPVIFTSFGFHGSIPAIVNYLDGDTNDLRKAMWIGSCIPLVIYIFWLLCSLGVVPQVELVENNSLNSLIHSLSAVLGGSNLSVIVGFFADLALVTSFLGVSLGLFEFIQDSTKKKFKGNRLHVALLTYLPPLAFALFYPEGFIMALGYAAIALVVLAIFLPAAMVLKSRRDFPNKKYYRVKGGDESVIAVSVIGALIIIAQLCVSFGFI
ncbi:aromatic amino acid transport family protein [Vibrio sp. B1Z05]|uniref:aromatic amino acid transport family protein n=1 Tax=Vibrio sp. B1Z05 TaxID=2654980 RepID=UPI00128B211A|nr:aromatic amino acid transport family protein [Vibrio sp. B1Z05]MPW35530.1 amino acid permease [Vibrio sp. B1Z05]